MDTFAAELTPPGKAAIACLGIFGTRTWDAVEALFRRGNNRPLPHSPGRAVYFGRFGDSAAASDEVVLIVRDRSHCEVLCHGGPEVVRLLKATLETRGIVPVSPAAFAERIHDAERSRILDVLSRCLTTRTASIALDQWHGAFDRAFADIATSTDPRPSLERLRQLANLGEHLALPWKVVFAGEPNVGKSSLVNALAGFTRSIVSPAPGTTRDVVSTITAFDGWPIELTDTAGLRDASDPLEVAGVARASAAHSMADLLIWTLDATRIPGELPPPGSLVVINKVDRSAAWNLDSQPNAIRTSAVTNEGIPALAQAIVGRFVPTPPRPREAVPITMEQRRRVDDACRQAK